GERVVDDQRQTMRMRDGGELLDIHELAARVGEAFDVQRLGPVVDQLLEARRIIDVCPADFPDEILEGLRELVDGAAVELARGDEIVPLLHQRVEDDEVRGLAGGRRERGRTALERGHALLQHRLGRVHDAGVDVAERFQAKQRGGVVGIVENEGGGLIDRRRARAGGGVGLRAGVDGKCVETRGPRHDFLLRSCARIHGKARGEAQRRLFHSPTDKENPLAGRQVPLPNRQRCLMPKLWKPVRITGFFEEMTRLLTPFQPISPESLPYSILGQRFITTFSPAASALAAASSLRMVSCIQITFGSGSSARASSTMAGTASLERKMSTMSIGTGT